MKLFSLAEKSGLLEEFETNNPSISALMKQDIDLVRLTADSRTVEPGTLFAALPGTKVDGAEFVASALEKGASAILADVSFVPPVNCLVPVLTTPDVRRAFAKITACFYAPQPQTIVAVTGTSGKTSVAGFVRQIWEYGGLDAASIGTLGVVSKGLELYGSLTTPDTVRLHELLGELARNGVTHTALEASSHGLEQRRLDGVELSAAAFTNLGRDHLDYHLDQEDYFQAKLGLFTRLLTPGRTVVLDSDEPWSDRVAGVAADQGQRVFSVGESGADIRVMSCRPRGAGQDLQLQCADSTFQLKFPLIGRFQVSNALVAAGLAVATGVELPDALAALETLTGAPGRLEHVGDHESGAHAFVDYAHKPDALETVLKTLRPSTRNRLIVVFGAGGDRDHGKRALMGTVAERYADVSIVTDDNPRSEEPAAIRAAILSTALSATEIGDRSQAIHTAVAMLREGDTLVIAGKGHEEGQTIGDQTLPFSDHKVLAEALIA